MFRHDHHTKEAACCEHSHEHGHKHEHEHEHSVSYFCEPICCFANEYVLTLSDLDEIIDTIKYNLCKQYQHDDIPAWKKAAMGADPNACPFGGTWGTEASVDATEDMPPMYSGDGSDDDFDKATAAKMAASDFKSQGLYDEALAKFNEAIVSAEPSALLLANRAHVLFKLNKYAAATRDCDAALEKNPDSAKALRIRGECHLKRGKFHDARKDLSAAQTIDFDEDAAMMLKEATEKCKEIDEEAVKKKLAEEEKLKKRAAEVRCTMHEYLVDSTISLTSRPQSILDQESTGRCKARGRRRG